MSINVEIFIYEKSICKFPVVVLYRKDGNAMNLINNRNFYFFNAVISTAALTFLVWLIYFRAGTSTSNLAVSALPAVNAILNSLCAILLISGYIAIKKRHEKLHEILMITAFCVSTLFLLSYVYYHSLQGDTKFLGEGWIRPVYFVLLISHILLSMIMLPMILSSIYMGLTEQRQRHRKIARFTLPIWLYVSITGVAIYFLLRLFS